MSKVWRQNAMIIGLSAIFIAQASLAQEPVSNSLIKRQFPKLRQATPTEEKKWNGSLGLTLQGKRFDSDKTQKSTTVFSVSGKLNYSPTPTVRFNLSPSFDYTNGYIQTDAETDASKSSWSVQNAGVDFLPNKFFTLSAGALDQNTPHTGIIFDSIAFPAAKIVANTNPEADYGAGLQAESAIVTSTNLSTNKQASEKTPTFQSVGFNVSKQNGAVEASLKALIYEFNNLPSSIAKSSSNVGNSTVKIGTNDPNFIYQYRGYLTHAVIKANLTRFAAIGIKNSWIKNTEAPDGYSQGTVTRLFSDIDVSKSLQISPYYDYFRIEPDATVASLNDSRYNTNRVGYLTGMAFSYNKSFKVTLLGGERDVVYTNPAQLRERVWTLKMETVNVTF